MSNTSAKVGGYQKSFKRHGIDPKALQWVSKDAAEVRYRELTADLDFEGRTILDIGCGFADIIPFIERVGNNFSYIGMDLMPEFIDAAQKKYPKHKFIVGDYFGNPLEDKHDITLTSGTLNSRIENAIEYRKNAIKLMFDNAGEVLAFNMAGGYPQPKSRKGGRVYFVDSLEILKYCISLTPKVIFRHHYRLKDFTVVMFK